MTTPKTRVPLTMTVSAGNNRFTVSVSNKPLGNWSRCKHYPDCHVVGIVRTTEDLGIICDLCRVVRILLKEHGLNNGLVPGPGGMEPVEDFYEDQPYWTPLKDPRKRGE